MRKFRMNKYGKSDFEGADFRAAVFLRAEFEKACKLLEPAGSPPSHSHMQIVYGKHFITHVTKSN